MKNIKGLLGKAIIASIVTLSLLLNNNMNAYASNLNLDEIRKKAAEQYGEDFAKTLYLEWNNELGEYELVIKKGVGNNHITRAEFATLIMENYKKHKGDIKADNMSKFHDTNDPNVYKALKVGIIKGKSEFKFDPNGKITREEIAMMIDRYVTALNLPVLSSGKDTKFTDQSSISNWANPSVQRLHKAGVLHGVGGGRINPKGFTKTKDAEALLKRVDEKINKK